jgi:hypothetical protein
MGEIKHNLLGQVRLEGNFEDYLQEEYQARVLLLLLYCFVSTLQQQRKQNIKQHERP